jgi:hypothetical protein
MGGDHSVEHQSTAKIATSKCVHGVYHPGELNEPNPMCSICTSLPKRELSNEEIKNAKKQNSIWE